MRVPRPAWRWSGWLWQLNSTFMAKRKLTLWLYEPHEMAELKEWWHSLHFGNYLDFK